MVLLSLWLLVDNCFAEAILRNRVHIPRLKLRVEREKISGMLRYGKMYGTLYMYTAMALLNLV